MAIYHALALGIVQGITEFFPISSSGHLVILQSVFGLKEPQLAFDLFLHIGTLLAITIFFRKDIAALFRNKRMAGIIILASMPAGVAGVCFSERVEALFCQPKTVGYMFLLTGLWLVSASAYAAYTGKRASGGSVGIVNALAVGIAQAVSIIPGISRSGATIATGILAGVERESAFRFAFLLAIPAIAGAAVLKCREIGAGLSGAEAGVFLLGGLAAMVSGLLAIKWFLRIVRNNRLYIFGIYCFAAGAAAIYCFR